MRIIKGLGEVWFVMTLIAMLWAFAAYSEGLTSSVQHSNSIGVVQYQDNPNTYKAGKVEVVGIIDDSINFRLQPLATYSLFTEDILFCDKQQLAEKFAGKRNPLLLTYKTKTSRLVRGVGCHELVRVDALASPEVK